MGLEDIVNLSMSVNQVNGILWKKFDLLNKKFKALDQYINNDGDLTKYNEKIRKIDIELEKYDE